MANPEDKVQAYQAMLPAKIADIQQTLAYGAHGPKTMIVLLLNHAV